MQCTEVEKKAQRILEYIKQHHNSRNKGVVLNLYNSFVQPLLECAVFPTEKTNRLERVQARVNKLITNFRNKCYEDHFRDFNLI